eukprot:jgi/Hompol1/795/HPOL_005415-RA
MSRSVCVIDELVDIVLRLGPGQAEMVLYDALARKNHELAMHLCERNEPRLMSFRTAIEMGTLDLVKLVHSKIPLSIRSAESWSIEEPCIAGSVETLWWLLADRENWRLPILSNIQDYAAAFGMHEILDFAILNSIGNPVSTRAMNLAARHGRLSSLKWLHEHRTEGCTQEAMDDAAENGHLEVIQWLHANRSEGCTMRAMNLAAKEGRLHIVQWLHENRTEGCHSSAIDWAAIKGHTHVVRFLHQNRTEGCTQEAIEGAITNHHIEIFRLLWSAYPSARPSIKEIRGLARIGSLWIAEYILETAPEYSEIINQILFDALKIGNTGCADILVQKFGAKPTPWLLEHLAEGGRLAGIQWLYQQVQHHHDLADPEGFSPDSLQQACDHGQLDLVLFFTMVCGIRITSRAAMVAPLYVFKYLLERDPQICIDAIMTLGDHADVEVYEWLNSLHPLISQKLAGARITA